MTVPSFTGVITPVLTPFNDDLSVAEDLYLSHCARVLDAGSHFLAPFGTTGEATSVTIAERKRMLELLISENVAEPEQLIPGTGLCALDETVDLTRHAVELGCAAVMTLPPFYYVNASDEGLYRYFGMLIERCGDPGPRICLYHIPPMTRIGFSPELTARLAAAFPANIVAYKDSSGDFGHTEAVLRAAPAIAVFPGSEAFLLKGMKAGAAGCISATCNTNVANIRKVYDLMQAGDLAAAESADEEIRTFREAVQDAGLIPALKSINAFATGDRRWLNTRPPLLGANRATGRQFCEAYPFLLASLQAEGAS